MLQIILHDLIRFLRTDHGPILHTLAGLLAPPIAALLAIRRGPAGAVPSGYPGRPNQPAAAQPASPQAGFPASTTPPLAVRREIPAPTPLVVDSNWLEDAIRERLEQRRLPALPAITMESTDDEVDSFVDAFITEQYPPGTGFAN